MTLILQRLAHLTQYLHQAPLQLHMQKQLRVRFFQQPRAHLQHRIHHQKGARPLLPHHTNFLTRSSPSPALIQTKASTLRAMVL